MADTSDGSEHLSVQDMQKWLRQELADLAKATELRTRQATDLVAAYSAGELSPKEAERRFTEYGERWGEALPGTHAFAGATDAEILAAIDETRRPDFIERFRTRTDRAFKGGQGGSSDKVR